MEHREAEQREAAPGPRGGVVGLGAHACHVCGSTEKLFYQVSQFGRVNKFFCSAHKKEALQLQRREARGWRGRTLESVERSDSGTYNDMIVAVAGK